MIKAVVKSQNQPFIPSTELEIEIKTFSEGEEHVKIKNITPSGKITITARIDSSQELIRLLLITDAIKRLGYSDIELVLPYIPYARQDRVCDIGESFSLKVFADAINCQNYTKVFVFDAHSLVALALINNVIEIPQEHFAHNLFEYVKNNADESYDYIIAPDVGSSKKALEFSKSLNTLGWSTEVVQALKVRDKSGAIISTKILHDNFSEKRCLIIDDICSGGRTFFPIAKELKEKGALVVGLYVTHGSFAYGLRGLFESGIDDIYTTNSIRDTDTFIDKNVHTIHNFF